MADIAKCPGENCTIKHHCWRYLCPASGWRQSYIYGKYEAGKCDHFWDAREDKAN